MKNLIPFFLIFILLGCSTNEEIIQNTNQNSITSFKEIVSYDTDTSNEFLFSREYTFDVNGNVLSEKLIHHNPQYNNTATYRYNNQGRVIATILNNVIVGSISWNGDFAEMYNQQNQKISEFYFSGDRLLEINHGFISGNIVNYKFNYDINGNVISEEKDNEVYVEYLNYNTNLKNPRSLLNSIVMFKLSLKPYIKNYFQTEKVYPYIDYDHYMPLSFYDYQYTLDSNNRINSMTDDKTLIYKTIFEYN